MKRENKTVYAITGDLNTDMNFAIYTSPDNLTKHEYAWKAWRTLREFGCKVYLVAESISIFEGTKVYPNLKSLNRKIDVVVLCLCEVNPEYIIKNILEIEAKYIWIQENSWDHELVKKCEEAGIIVVKGCVLKHKIYKKPFAFFNPCYWHGLKEKKIPAKYKRI